MAYTQSQFPGVMQLASTSETQSLNQVIPFGSGNAGMGALNFDGTGLFGSGLFSSGLDLTQWGVFEWAAVAFGGLYVLPAIFGSSAKERRTQLTRAKQDYEKRRESILKEYPRGRLRRVGSAPRRIGKAA
jgi:hypothetical protein